MCKCRELFLCFRLSANQYGILGIKKLFVSSYSDVSLFSQAVSRFTTPFSSIQNLGKHVFNCLNIPHAYQISPTYPYILDSPITLSPRGQISTTPRITSLLISNRILRLLLRPSAKPPVHALVSTHLWYICWSMSSWPSKCIIIAHVVVVGTVA